MLLLFDIDGVINYSEYFTIKYCDEFGVDKNVFDLFFKTEFNLALRGEADLKQLLPNYFKKWKWDKNADEFLMYWFYNDIRLNIELVSTLKKLKNNGYTLGIASQQEKYRKSYLLNLPQLKDLFEECYFSCDIGYLKTDIEFYSSLLVKEREIYFWDDTVEVVDMAKKNGINSYLYSDISIFKNQLSTITKREF